VAAVLAEEGHEHVLVVAAQEDRLTAPRVAELDQPVDDGFRTRPAVDVVAEEHELVAGLWIDRAEQHDELVDAAVDVSDGEQSAACRGAERR